MTDSLTGANTLLAYFHYCNKGIYPFSYECRDQDLQILAALDNWAISFIHDTRRYADEHSKWPRFPHPPSDDEAGEAQCVRR